MHTTLFQFYQKINYSFFYSLVFPLRNILFVSDHPFAEFYLLQDVLSVQFLDVIYISSFFFKVVKLRFFSAQPIFVLFKGFYILMVFYYSYFVTRTKVFIWSDLFFTISFYLHFPPYVSILYSTRLSRMQVMSRDTHFNVSCIKCILSQHQLLFQLLV